MKTPGKAASKQHMPTLVSRSTSRHILREEQEDQAIGPVTQDDDCQLQRRFCAWDICAMMAENFCCILLLQGYYLMPSC